MQFEKMQSVGSKSAWRVGLVFRTVVGLAGVLAVGPILNLTGDAVAAERRCSRAPTVKLNHTSEPIEWEGQASLPFPVVGQYQGALEAQYSADCSRILFDLTIYHKIRIGIGEAGNACVRGHELRHKKIADKLPGELKTLLRRRLRPGMTKSAIKAAVLKAYSDAQTAVQTKQKKFDAVYGHMDTINCRYAPTTKMKPKVYKKGG